MSKQTERENFLLTMQSEGVPADVARLVLRHAASLHRLAELECSSEAYDRDRVKCPGDYARGQCLCRDYGDYRDPHGTHDDGIHGTIPRGAVRQEKLQARVTKLLAPYKVTPVFNGDPRGAVVKLKVPSGRTDDWGRTGVCVP